MNMVRDVRVACWWSKVQAPTVSGHTNVSRAPSSSQVRRLHVTCVKSTETSSGTTKTNSCFFLFWPQWGAWLRNMKPHNIWTGFEPFSLLTKTWGVDDLETSGNTKRAMECFSSIPETTAKLSVWHRQVEVKQKPTKPLDSIIHVQTILAWCTQTYTVRIRVFVTNCLKTNQTRRLVCTYLQPSCCKMKPSGGIKNCSCTDGPLRKAYTHKPLV